MSEPQHEHMGGWVATWCHRQATVERFESNFRVCWLQITSSDKGTSEGGQDGGAGRSRE